MPEWVRFHRLFAFQFETAFSQLAALLQSSDQNRSSITDHDRTMPSTPDIRAATLGDLPLIQAVEQAASTLFPIGRLPDSDQPLSIRTLQQGLDDGLLWVSTAEHSIVGFALASQHDNRLHLEELDVHPDQTRNGYGTALVETIVSIARQRQCEAVTLTTFIDLPFNAPFYQRLGFVAVTPATSHSMLDSILIIEALAGLKSRIGMIKWLE